LKYSFRLCLPFIISAINITIAIWPWSPIGLDYGPDTNVLGNNMCSQIHSEGSSYVCLTARGGPATVPAPGPAPVPAPATSKRKSSEDEDVLREAGMRLCVWRVSTFDEGRQGNSGRFNWSGLYSRHETLKHQRYVCVCVCVCVCVFITVCVCDQFLTHDAPCSSYV